MREPIEIIEISDPARLVCEPLVSVHMITYNHEAYLAEAIESIINQKTSIPYELVIGEDCSTDRTRGIALDYQRRFPDRIRVLYSARNVGAFANATRVFDACRGKYVAPCEGDDYWHNPAKLEMQCRFLEQHPDFVMVHANYRLQKGERIQENCGPVHDLKPSEAEAFESLLLYNHVITCTVVVRTELQRQFHRSKHFGPQFPMGDYQVWLYASRQGRIGYFGTSLGTYRRTIGSATNSGWSAAVRMVQALRTVGEHYMEEAGSAEALRHRVRQEHNQRLLMLSSLAGDRNVFHEEFAWLCRHNPDWRRNYRNRLRKLILKLRLESLLRWRVAIARRVSGQI